MNTAPQPLESTNDPTAGERETRRDESIVQQIDICEVVEA